MMEYNDQAQQELITYLKSLSPEGFEKIKNEFLHPNVNSSVRKGDPVQQELESFYNGLSEVGVVLVKAFFLDNPVNSLIEVRSAIKKVSGYLGL